MRIIAGSARGRVLKAPRKSSVRPTADRVKESIFNVLGQWLDGERVLDLYAGVGSLGLEALSRGAAHATFVEADPDVITTLAANIRMLGFESSTTTLLKSADRAIRSLGGKGESFSLILADPPYAARAGAMLLTEIGGAGILVEGGRFVLEHDRREVLPAQSGELTRVDERRFGDTLVSLYARAEAGAPSSSGSDPRG